MRLDDIRGTFIDYFVGNGHTLVKSSSLVPDNDPTLLFTNSGMVQFKDVFTGKETRPYRRATSVQKSIRINGKHDDLDNVGYDGRHHTLFEMLGNWSFGDYFKERAIAYSWELLTKVFGLPKEKLYFTVYPTDTESRGLWKKIAGVSDDRIIDIEGNLWAMGPTGPNGYDTEIFYDQGDSVWGGPPGSKDEDGDRYLEIWNDVFMQFETFEDGTTVELKSKSVDTGMGLERIAAVLQGVHSNFDIDLFKGIIADVEDILSVKKDSGNAVSFNVIADHIRAVSFLIADGVMPSNEGRGYVLRRIVRRALRHIHMLGVKESALYRMAGSVKDRMGAAYPELAERYALIRETIRAEEENFGATLDAGLKILEDEVAKADGKVLPGASAFRLYDTYGFPLDMTADILKARGMAVDVEGFDSAMSEQKERSRRAGNFKGEAGTAKVWYDVRERVGETKFVGYDMLEADATVLDVIPALSSCHSDPEELATRNRAGIQCENTSFVIVDRTPFYAEMGGQVADRGTLGGAEVLDVQKINGIFAHKVADASMFEIGDKVRLVVDAPSRRRTMSNHSAAHLLQKALKTVVGEHVSQKGSWVGPTGLRFDFTNPRGLTRDEIGRVERMVNEMIAECLPITKTEMPLDEAKKTGAIALFGEKYGERVRVVDMGGKSVELCGGTHADNTGDIGFFKILKEESIAAGVRRVEAVTGTDALDIAAKYGLDTDGNPAALIAMLQEKIRAENELAAQKQAEEFAQKKKAGDDARAREIESAISKIKTEKIGACEFASAILDDVDGGNLKGVAYRLTGKYSAIALVSNKGGKVSMLVALSPELARKISAVELVKIASAATGGKGGGGRPELAQAGGADPARAATAIEEVKKALEKI
ncbi:MAG: alanine--tRNA ligase [Rickettsiales bacterium]|jgi:alanyl-tRNA synthetase|nr:alanine--tRNA ligase [Rickettsiales bacterium]